MVPCTFHRTYGTMAQVLKFEKNGTSSRAGYRKEKSLAGKNLESGKK